MVVIFGKRSPEEKAQHLGAALIAVFEFQNRVKVTKNSEFSAKIGLKYEAIYL